VIITAWLNSRRPTTPTSECGLSASHRIVAGQGWVAVSSARPPRPLVRLPFARPGPRNKFSSVLVVLASKNSERGVLSDLTPPRPLSILARQMFDRHAARIHAEGRFKHIDVDQLCSYVECVETYLKCKEAVDAHGILVQGRTEKELVRNPALTPLNQARVALPVLARAVPLVNPKVDTDAVAVDHLLEQLRGNDEGFN
jgi:phage terminase small subunit